jgi:RNA polymerase sigma-70 factor, ECF subfamily
MNKRTPQTPMTAAERRRVAEVITEYLPYIESVARRHAITEDQVPDIVQNVSLKVCRGLNGFREDAKIRTWLHRVVVNEAIDIYRTERRHLRVYEAVAVEHPTEPAMPADQPDHVSNLERLEALREGIDRLKPFYRDLVRNDLEHPTVLMSSKATRWRARQELRRQLAGDPRLHDDDGTGDEGGN